MSGKKVVHYHRHHHHHTPEEIMQGFLGMGEQRCSGNHVQIPFKRFLGGFYCSRHARQTRTCFTSIGPFS